MTPATVPNVMLWNRARRAYLAASGDGFTRKMERAAVMTQEQATPWLKDHGFGEMLPEITFAPVDFKPWPPRADLAGTDEKELLRRAVRNLCARDRSQAPHWALVMDALGLTSGAAVMLCRRLDIDPNERTGH